MMEQLIHDFPQNLLDGIQIAKNQQFSALNREVRNVVICGMGGSGIGGKIVSQWVEKDLNVPVTLCQDYDIPSFVGPHTLVIASSYSGNTEETLSSVYQAEARDCMIVGISSGGTLAKYCEEKGYNCTIVPGGNPPRTALAFSLVQLTNTFEKLGLLAGGHMDLIQKGHDLILSKMDEIKKQAMLLAKEIGEKVPVFYADAKYEGVAVRAKQQFNENSKKLCWHQVIPEMNHNELVGWGGGSAKYAPVFFLTEDTNRRNARRTEISIERTKDKSGNAILVNAVGGSNIERSLYLIHIIDWASYYHADIHNVDSIEIDIIDYLKDELGKM